VIDVLGEANWPAARLISDVSDDVEQEKLLDGMASPEGLGATTVDKSYTDEKL